MGYINNNTGYLEHHTLSSRSVIKKNMYALITPDGLVKNNIYGFENCDISILSSPLLGASFTDYIITVKENGRNLCGIGNESEEIFLFVIEGSLLVYNDNEKAGLTAGGFFFSPASFKLYFQNNSNNNAKILLYKRKYKPLNNLSPKTISGNINNIPYKNFEEMDSVFIKVLQLCISIAVF